jgi:prenyltransferase beta subunit
MNPPELLAPLAELAMSDGAYGSRQLDLFATYSATTALRDIEHRPDSHLATARAVLGSASTQGVGETIGAAPDAWSTTYASGTLLNLGYVAPSGWAAFLTSLERDGGYSMFPGGDPDAWATGFAPLALGRLDPAQVNKRKLARWVGSAQALDGGITWTPMDAPQEPGDVRATGFVVDALRQVDGVHLLGGYLDSEALVAFVIDQQGRDGGFALNSRNTPCMWGTAEAATVLDAFEIPIPNRAAVVDFVMSYFNETTGGFRRGPAFKTGEDVWATRQAVRILRIVDSERLGVLAPQIGAFLKSCALPGGGYTYCTIDHAGDVLSTSAAILAGYADGGFAYMPGRGAEARTSQWATAALDATGSTYDVDALLTWASRSQNHDGGFGRWAGRASEPVPTAAVVATLVRAKRLQNLPGLATLGNWVDAAIGHLDEGHQDDAVIGANLVRSANAITTTSGQQIDVTPCLRVINRLGVDGAYRRRARAVPDLATTYAVLLAHQAIGEDRTLAAARSWLNYLTVFPNGVAWSPASSEGGGLLASALATLVLNATDGTTLPDLSL